MKKTPEIDIIILAKSNYIRGVSMNNYTILNANIKRKIVSYTTKICKNDETLPKTKFVNDMIFGLIKSQSTHISKISRTLKETTHLNQTISRLDKSLDKYELTNNYDNYLNELKCEVDDDTIFCVDNSDMIKPHGYHFESMGYVKDGSSKNNNIEKGYHLAEIVMLGKNKQPRSVYSHIYSETQSGFISSNDETFKSLDKSIATFGNKGIYTFDRGYDADKYIEYGVKKDINFIIRSKKNRKCIHKNKKKSVDNVILDYKGRIVMTLSFQDKVHTVSVSHIKIKPLCVDESLNLVVIHGFNNEVFKLISNMEIKSKEDVKKIVCAYFSRWRIEEYFKFKKQQFGFEDIRVRSLNKLRNLNTLLTISIGFISILSSEIKDNILVMAIKDYAHGLKQKVKFWLYRIADGLSVLLSLSNKGIRDLITPKKQEQDYNLFSLYGINLDTC